MTAMVTIEFVVPTGYVEGDYALLCGNNGSDVIDWNNPLADDKLPLFPNGGGIFGWGHAPWGNFRWGHAHAMRVPGWGHLPWGHFPWGYGTAIVTVEYEVDSCGVYRFGLACYDSLGNAHTGTPDEVELGIDIAPEAPAGLAKNSYNKDTDVLVLNAA